MLYVVIPTHNRPIALYLLVKELDYQLTDLHPVSVLIVNSGLEISLPQNLVNPKRFKQLKVSRYHYWTRSVAAGVKYLSSTLGAEDYLLLLNDDIILPRHYLNSCIANLPLQNQIYTSFVHTIYNNYISDEMPISKFNSKNLKFERKILKKSYLCFKQNLYPVGILTGRGSIIPFSLFKKKVNLNWMRFPHYLGDYNLAINAQGQKFIIYLHQNLNVFSFDNYGADIIEKNLFKRFFYIKSPSNIFAHFLFLSKNYRFLKNEYTC